MTTPSPAKKVLTLSDVVSFPEKYALTEAQKDSFVAVVGEGARFRTCVELRTFIEDTPNMSNYSIFGRVSWNGDSCEVCAAQHYDTDIAGIIDRVRVSLDEAE